MKIIRRPAKILVLGLAIMSVTDVCATENQPKILKPCGAKYGVLASTITSHMPPTGMDSDVEIGQSMVATYNTNVMDGISSLSFALDQDLKFSERSLWHDFDVLVPSGNEVLHGGDKPYKPADYTFKYRSELSPRTGFSKPDLFISMDTLTRIVSAKLKIGFSDIEIPVGMALLKKTEQCERVGSNGFKRELVYSGVSKGTITLLYREFLNDMARPAFSQELKYDLGEGNVIGFKGARFQVVKATNLGIMYKVLKHLD